MHPLLKKAVQILPNELNSSISLLGFVGKALDA
jgi:hypothetical protein